MGDRELEHLLSAERTAPEMERDSPYAAPEVPERHSVPKPLRRSDAERLRRLLTSVEALDAPSLRLALEAASVRRPTVEFLEGTIVPTRR